MRIPVLTAVLLAQLAALHAADALKPNVLFITADVLDLQLSCDDDKHIQTPHLDSLAVCVGAQLSLPLPLA